MKSVSAYYLLLLYVTVMLSPFVPIANDWIQHEFNDVAHIASVHAVYGNNHLEKEVTNDSNKNKNQSLVKSQSQISVHIPTIEAFLCTPPAFIVSKSHFGIYKEKWSFSLVNNLAPPPKLSLSIILA